MMCIPVYSSECIDLFIIDLCGCALAACRSWKTRKKRLKTAGRMSSMHEYNRRSRQAATHSSSCRSVQLTAHSLMLALVDHMQVRPMYCAFA